MSPLFIGSGDKYSQLDYISEGQKIYVLNFDKILSQIASESIDDLTNDILKNFKNNIWEGNVKDFLEQYNLNWKKYVEKEYDLIGQIGKNEINEFVKEGDRVYVPGSSVKGAIRTAILFDILKQKSQKKNVIEKRIIQNFNDRDVIQLLKTIDNDHLLRAFVVSDFNLKGEKEVIKIVETTVYHLKDKKSTIPIFYEAAVNPFVGSGVIKINSILTDVKSKASENFTLTKENVINAINSFAKEIIQYELQEFKARNDSNLNEIIGFYENLKKELEQLKPNESLLRLGQGSSALGLTLFLIFRDNKEIVRKYKGLEVITFDSKDRFNPSELISRQERIIVKVDKKSEFKPALKETWLCSIQAKKNTKFAKLLAKITSSEDLNKQELLYPITRKFIVTSGSKIISPFGWVKLTWD